MGLDVRLVLMPMPLPPLRCTTPSKTPPLRLVDKPLGLPYLLLRGPCALTEARIASCPLDDCTSWYRIPRSSPFGERGGEAAKRGDGMSVTTPSGLMALPALVPWEPAMRSGLIARPVGLFG